MIALWKYRTLSPEEQMEMIADIDQGDDSSIITHGQVEETDTFVGVDEVNLTEVYATELPLSVSRKLNLLLVHTHHTHNKYKILSINASTHVYVYNV